MNNQIWRNTIIGIVAAFAVSLSVGHAAAQNKSKAQKECDKAHEEANNAVEEADRAKAAADKAPSGQADADADKADKQAEKDQQDYRDAQDKADKSQGDVNNNVRGSGEQARRDQSAADKARDQAQDSENKADAADKKADKNENDKNPQWINRHKQKEKRKKLQQAWDKCRKLNGLALGFAPPVKSVGTYVASGQAAVAISGTGETIGHVATMTIQNLSDQPINCSVGPMILESSSGKNQDYAVPQGQSVAVNPHGSATVPLNGVCLVRGKPPVGNGAVGDLAINDGHTKIPENTNSHIAPGDAVKMLHIAASKYDAAEQLQKSGALNDLPYHDKQKQKDICVQWSTWMDPRICEITGGTPATKEDLKNVVYKQLEEQGPVTPETKKKVDQGIDTIFAKVELTTAKAKDLEEPSSGETDSGEEGNGKNADAGSFNVSNDTPTPAPQTQEKKEKKEKKDEGKKDVKWPPPVQAWIEKIYAASRARIALTGAQVKYQGALYDFCLLNSPHFVQLNKAEEDICATSRRPLVTAEDQAKCEKAKKETDKQRKALEKDFLKTPDGQKKAENLNDAQKAADKAAVEEKEAGKNIPQETKDLVQEAQQPKKP